MTLGEFIIDNQKHFKYSSGELSRLINSIRLAAKVVNHEIRKAGLVDITGAAGDINIQGEAQQKLDVLANDIFKQTIINREIVCGIASEEEDDFVIVEGKNKANDNKYVLLMDPLDGSSNIDVNVSVGTIFSIYRRVSPEGSPVTQADFLQKGSEQVAAGYVVYGTSTMLVFTTGKGVHGFTLNPAIGTFYLSHPDIQHPKRWKNIFYQRRKLCAFSTRSQRIFKILSRRKRQQTLYLSIYWFIGFRFSSKHDQRRYLFISNKCYWTKRKTTFAL